MAKGSQELLKNGKKENHSGPQVSRRGSESKVSVQTSLKRPPSTHANLNVPNTLNKSQEKS